MGTNHNDHPVRVAVTSASLLFGGRPGWVLPNNVTLAQTWKPGESGTFTYFRDCVEVGGNGAKFRVNVGRASK